MQNFPWPVKLGKSPVYVNKQTFQDWFSFRFDYLNNPPNIEWANIYDHTITFSDLETTAARYFPKSYYQWGQNMFLSGSLSTGYYVTGNHIMLVQLIDDAETVLKSAYITFGPVNSNSPSESTYQAGKWIVDNSPPVETWNGVKITWNPVPVPENIVIWSHFDLFLNDNVETARAGEDET